MSNEVQVQDLPAVTNVDRPMSVNELLRQSMTIHEVLTRVMVGPTAENPQGIHYGLIPGTPKPTLYQAGAEKICSTFRLAPRYDVEDLCEPHNNFYRYRVKCSIVTIRDGMFVGSAMGEASTAEEKYQWEKAVCQKQWDLSDPDKRRIKFQRQKNNDEVTEILQVQRNCADLANTVLKISCKRAFISAVKGATAASDILDVDMDEEAVAELAKAEQKEAPKQKAKAAPSPKLAFGRSKGKAIDDLEVPIDDLVWMRDYLERGLNDTKRSQYHENDKKMIDKLQTELSRREASSKQASNGAEPGQGATMTKEEWVGYCIEQFKDHEEAYTQASLDFKTQDPSTLPFEAWGKFRARMQELTK